MRKSDPPNMFELESLEQRILLSGDPLFGAYATGVPDELDTLSEALEGLPAVEEIRVSDSDVLSDSTSSDSTEYDPSHDLNDLFGGLADQDLLSESAGGEDTESDTSDDTGSDTVSESVFSPGHEFTGTEVNALRDGLASLSNLNAILEELDGFPEFLIEAEGLDGGGVLGLYEVVDTRLQTSVYDYFGDSVDPPGTYTVEGFVQALRSYDDATCVFSTIEVGYLSDSNELRFDIQGTAARTGEVYLDTPIFDDDASILVGQGSSAYSATLEFDFGFGVKDGEFFVEARDLDLGVIVSSGAGETSAETVGTTTSLHTVEGSLGITVPGTRLFNSTLTSITIETAGAFFLLEPEGALFDGLQGQVAGSLHLSEEEPYIADSTVVIPEGGTLSGSGSILGEVVNEGIISPGNSPGEQNLGTLTLTPEGTVVIEIAGTTPGTEYDVINVTNLASLDGTLSISLIDGFTPSLGQTFTFLNFGSVSGDFGEFTGLYLGEGLYFKPVLGANAYDLVVSELPGGIETITPDDPQMRDDLMMLLSGKSTSDVSIGGSIEIAGFVTVSGTIGFKKDGSQYTAVGENVTTLLETESFSAGVLNADFAMVIDGAARVMYATGEFQLSGGDFLNALGTVTVKENTTGQLFTAQAVSVGVATVNVPELAAGLQSVSGTGLSFDVSGFVSLSGDFGFKKTGAEIIAVGSGVTASLDAGGAVSVSLSDADFGLKAGSGTTAFELKNGVFAASISGLAEIGAASVLVRYTGHRGCRCRYDPDGGQYQLAIPSRCESRPNTIAFEVTGFCRERCGLRVA